MPTNAYVRSTLMETENDKFIEKFFPKGAIAFFGCVLLVMATIWLFVYWTMIKQA